MVDEVAQSQADKIIEAQKVLDAHRDDLVAWHNAVAAANLAGATPPPPPPTIVDAVATIGTTLGGVALGVGSTAADAVGVVGGTVDALHTNVDTFFTNLRQRLGF